MRFFHLSDLHIGLKLIRRELTEDQNFILDQIITKAVERKPDVILIAGDIYDKSVPSSEAIEVFDRFISSLKRRLPATVIMIISGNHDNAVRLDCYRHILCDQNVFLIGQPPSKEGEQIEKVTLMDAYGPVNFWLLPFIKPSMVQVREENEEEFPSYQETLRRLLDRTKINETERNVFLSHQFYLPAGKSVDSVERMDSEIRIVGNIDSVSAELLKDFDYCALGHIHKPMSVGSDYIRYSGSPLSYSFSEANQQKSIPEVNLFEKGNITVELLPLTPLRQVIVVKGALQEVLKRACEDYVTVVLTDNEEFNPTDLFDRLKLSFPYLLHIRRENYRTADYEMETDEETLLHPYELCCSFLKGMDEIEKEIIMDVIKSVKEEHKDET